MFRILYYLYQILSWFQPAKLEDLQRKPNDSVIPKPPVEPVKPEPVVPKPIVPDYPETYTQMLKLINSFRVKEGKKELVLDKTLCQAAQEHTDWMEKKNALSHKGFDDRANKYDIIAENVAMGNRDTVSIFGMWRQSRGHRVNMLSNASLLGVGEKNGWWTTVFK